MRPVTPQGVPHGVMSEVSLGSWRLPPGTMVMPLHWAANHQPRTWPQPEQFNPNRFLDKDGCLVTEIDIYPFQVIYRWIKDKDETFHFRLAREDVLEKNLVKD